MSPPDAQLVRFTEPSDRVDVPRPSDRFDARSTLNHALLAGASLAGLAIASPELGLRWGLRISLLLWVGVLAVRLFPARAHLLAGLTGVAVLSQWTAGRFLTYQLIL